MRLEETLQTLAMHLMSPKETATNVLQSILFQASQFTDLAIFALCTRYQVI